MFNGSGQRHLLACALAACATLACQTSGKNDHQRAAGYAGIFTDGFAADDGEGEPELQHDFAAGEGLLFGGDGSDHGFDWPINGDISSEYGRRRWRFHHGIDIRAPKGSKVRTAGPGMVEFVGWQHGYGNVVIVRHRQFKTVYAHLARAYVSRGDRVARLDPIGASGRSGRATGPHLHFEIRDLKGDSIDPLSVIEKRRLLTSRH